jgi:hypothetical protein
MLPQRYDGRIVFVGVSNTRSFHSLETANQKRPLVIRESPSCMERKKFHLVEAKPTLVSRQSHNDGIRRFGESLENQLAFNRR